MTSSDPYADNERPVEVWCDPLWWYPSGMLRGWKYPNAKAPGQAA